jgi:hypothetical protein
VRQDFNNEKEESMSATIVQIIVSFLFSLSSGYSCNMQVANGLAVGTSGEWAQGPAIVYDIPDGYTAFLSQWQYAAEPNRFITTQRASGGLMAEGNAGFQLPFQTNPETPTIALVYHELRLWNENDQRTKVCSLSLVNFN